MIKIMPKPAFLGCLLTSLVIGPFFDFARGGAPLALPNDDRGIFAALATDCTIFAAANGNDANDGTKHVDGTIHPKTMIDPAASSVRFYDNVISNTGGSGIGTQNCDYVTADHNIIAHNGYIPAGADPNIAQYYSWTSGISYNINQCSDSYDGLHLIIANNIVVGEVDQSPNHKDANGRHTDGGGIILDYDTDTAPPVITCPYPDRKSTRLNSSH